MFDFVESTAVFSNDGLYRYQLRRIWDQSKPKVMFIGLNPSYANETESDPTLTRCINFAKSWGFGGLIMTNLFAFVDDSPERMKAASDPIGIENDVHLMKCAEEADIVIAAWGNDGGFKDRHLEISTLIPSLHCLKINATGQPSHPLYLKSSLKPLKYELKQI